jgi:SAM-dependent methyltransferase
MQRDEGLQRYACIGSFRFLDLALSLDPSYSTILARLKSGETFLDLGCCTGQEVRKLVVDGAPSENLYGSDLFPEFFDLGYKLFGDKETLKSTFIAADIFDSESGLKNLDGKVDIIFAGSFLHLFGLAAQKEACRRIVKLLRAKEGSVFLGKQLGNMKAGVHRHRRNPGQTSWAHDEESFRRMWKEVGEETGSEWKVDFTYLDPAVEDIRMRGNAYSEGLRRIQFKVLRV